MKKGLSSTAIRRLITVSLVVVLGVVFGVLNPVFISFDNIVLLLQQAGYLGLIACGLSIVMIGGGIDLSVGGIVCAVGVFCIHLSDFGLSGYVVFFLAILIGGALGVFNGFLVTKVGLTEFVATLASGFMFFGFGLIFAFRDQFGTMSSHMIDSESYLFLGSKFIGGFYLVSVLWVLIAVAFYILMHKTKFGLYTYAIGSNQKSAKMSGVNVTKVKWIGFIISGATAGLASFLQTAMEKTASTSLGNMYEFLAIAACVTGGVVLGGGKGDAISAFLGALFLAMIMNGLRKFGISPNTVYIVQGTLIIVAIAFDAQFAKIAYRKRLKEQRLSSVNMV